MEEAINSIGRLRQILRSPECEYVEASIVLGEDMLSVRVSKAQVLAGIKADTGELSYRGASLPQWCPDEATLYIG